MKRFGVPGLPGANLPLGRESGVTNIGGKTTLKLRVPSPPAQYTVVQGAAPVGLGIRCVQHFPLLGPLPAPLDGWSDITKLYVDRYGEPPPGMVFFIRTCQHIDGASDVPKLTSALVPKAF